MTAPVLENISCFSSFISLQTYCALLIFTAVHFELFTIRLQAKNQFLFLLSLSIKDQAAGEVESLSILPFALKQPDAGDVRRLGAPWRERVVPMNT